MADTEEILLHNGVCCINVKRKLKTQLKYSYFFFIPGSYSNEDIYTREIHIDKQYGMYMWTCVLDADMKGMAK